MESDWVRIFWTIWREEGFEIHLDWNELVAILPSRVMAYLAVQKGIWN